MGTQLHFGFRISVCVRDEISLRGGDDADCVLDCCGRCGWVEEWVDDGARPPFCFLPGELWVCDGRGAGGDCPPWGQGVGRAREYCGGDAQDGVPYPEDAVGLGRVCGRVPNVLPVGHDWGWS